MSSRRSAILVEGETCWRTAHADRVAVLVDGASYFAAARSALLKAEHSVFIVGWDVDSRTRLLPARDPERDPAPDQLGPLLTHLVETRPWLKVHILLWDYSIVFALEREPLPAVNLGWATPPQIRVCLDDLLPMGACHHQKILIVDDAVAFCGGMDLTIRRWDIAEHPREHPFRHDPAGEPYGPFHDVQMAVDGEAAAALGRLVRERWRAAACERPPPLAPKGDPWPDDVAPDFTDATVGVARTMPAIEDKPAVREVEQLFLRSIEAARRLVYVENQYMTSEGIAAALAGQLARHRRLEVILVGPETQLGWLEAQSMGAGRIRFMRQLHEAGVADRARLLCPAIGDGDDAHTVMVHAKLMVVDDRVLHVGSANVANRSMGVDTECDLALEAQDDAQRAAIAGVRNRLIGEHLGVSAEAVGEALDREPSAIAAIERLSNGERRLRPVSDAAYDSQLSVAIADIADPERPLDPSQLLGDMFGGAPRRRRLSRTAKLAIAGAVLIGMALAWRYTPLSGLTDVAAMEPFFKGLRASGWAFLLVPLIYVLGGLVAFPVTVLIALTAVAFGPWLGVAYALAGSLASAAVTYYVGDRAGRSLLRNVIGRRINRIGRALRRQGVLSVAAVRAVPVAPFTLVNLVAGASHIRFRDYMLGTVLGLTPGIVIIAMLGHRLHAIWQDPNPANLGLLAGVIALWLAVSVLAQQVVTRLLSKHGG